MLIAPDCCIHPQCQAARGQRLHLQPTQQHQQKQYANLCMNLHMVCTSLHMYVLAWNATDGCMHVQVGSRLVCPPLVDPSISLSLSVYSSYQYICYICLRAKNYQQKITMYLKHGSSISQNLWCYLDRTRFSGEGRKKNTSCNLMYENSSVLQLVPPLTLPKHRISAIFNAT